LGGAFSRGRSQEVARLIATAQLKMEDVFILCNVIEIFLQRKVTKTKGGGLFVPLKFHMALAQSCKSISTCLSKHPNTSIAEGRK
jgi:hypothetical protein